MSERGAAAVVLLGVAGLVVMLSAGVGGVGMMVAARLQAAAAADAAALAAAPVTFAPFGAAGSPADEAKRFAEANGTRLVSCRCPVDRSFNTRTVEVVVENPVRIPVLGVVAVRASSRAEFAPAKLLAP